MQISKKNRALIAFAVVAVMLVSVIGLVACGEDKTPVQSTDILKEDGRYEMTGMQAQIPMHPENFGDTLVVEKLNGVYYVTVEVLNNTKVERMFWKGRKKYMDTDCVKVVDGQNTKYMFAFNNENVQKTLKFQIGGGRMPIEPPFEFTIDFANLKRVGDADANAKRPNVFL